MRGCDGTDSVCSRLMVSLAGPLAMIGCEPRQAWKGATVIADSCAVVWLAGGASNRYLYIITNWAVYIVSQCHLLLNLITGIREMSSEYTLWTLTGIR